jgi:hypothetical protein
MTAKERRVERAQFAMGHEQTRWRSESSTANQAMGT